MHYADFLSGYLHWILEVANEYAKKFSDEIEI
jgi:hypothetical protein